MASGKEINAKEIIKMKTINVQFTEEEHKRLDSHKDFLMMNWHDYIINCTEFSRNEEFNKKHARVLDKKEGSG